MFIKTFSNFQQNPRVTTTFFPPLRWNSQSKLSNLLSSFLESYELVELGEEVSKFEFLPLYSSGALISEGESSN